MTKVYIASRYSRRPEMEQYANFLKTRGYEIVSSWVYGEEEGKSDQDIAILDYEDLKKADVILSFTDPRGTYQRGGGRHTEFGMGYVLGKDCYLIGEREQVFHFLPGVFQCNNLQDFIEGNFSYV